MQRLTYFLITFFSLAFITLSHSFMEIHLTPGINWFGDGIGYNGMLYFQTDLRTILPGSSDRVLMGAAALFSYAHDDRYNLTVAGMNGALLLGYDIFGRFGPIRLTPLCAFGYGYNNFQNSGTNAGLWGPFIMPLLRAEFPINNFLTIGVDCGFQALFVDMPGYPLVMMNISTSLSIGILLWNTLPPASEQSTAPAPKPAPAETKKITETKTLDQIMKMPVPEIVNLSKTALSEGNTNYAKTLIREGLVKEPDNSELLELFKRLINK